MRKNTGNMKMKNFEAFIILLLYTLKKIIFQQMSHIIAWQDFVRKWF